MIFITGPLYSGKRTFAQRLPGTRIAEVQAWPQRPRIWKSLRRSSPLMIS